MDDQQKINHVIDVQNGSEQEIVSPVEILNDSEQTGILLGTVPNDSEQWRSEVRNGSEEPLNHSEQVRNENVVTYRTAPSCSVVHEEMTITVREAARIFEEAGVPRTERVITNWCNQNARGVTRLNCCYDENERKYYISPHSIEKVIVEERKKNQYTEYQSESLYSASAEELAEQVRSKVDISEEGKKGNENVEYRSEPYGTEMGSIPNASEQYRQSFGKVQNDSERRREEVRNTNARPQPKERKNEESGAEERERLKEFQIENYELRIQLEGQKYLIRKFDELVAGERERHEKEKLALIDRLADARYRIGSLEQQLLQIEAPKAEGRFAEVRSGGEPDETEVGTGETEQGQWQRYR